MHGIANTIYFELKALSCYRVVFRSHAPWHHDGKTLMLLVLRFLLVLYGPLKGHDHIRSPPGRALHG